VCVKVLIPNNENRLTRGRPPQKETTTNLTHLADKVTVLFTDLGLLSEAP
jgi:hypothetical protein